jgi:hypothetical protein
MVNLRPDAHTDVPILSTLRNGRYGARTGRPVCLPPFAVTVVLCANPDRSTAPVGEDEFKRGDKRLYVPNRLDRAIDSGPKFEISVR